MAKTVKKLPGTGDMRHTKPRAEYPWQTWFNGDLWELTPGVDFAEVPIAKFQALTARVGRRRGLWVVTKKKNGKLYVKAIM